MKTKTVYVVQQEEQETGQWFDACEEQTKLGAWKRLNEMKDRWQWKKLRIIKRTEEVIE